MGDENRIGRRTGRKKQPLKKITSGKFAVYNSRVSYTRDCMSSEHLGQRGQFAKVRFPS